MRKSGSNHDAPTLTEERALRQCGYTCIAGMDEAGRGALAGPVVAAAVILPHCDEFPSLREVRDSKKLPPAKRDHLYDIICREALAVGVGIIESYIIDHINILEATKAAMVTAINNLKIKPDFLIIDAVTIQKLTIPQKGIVKGDSLCFSISCASIIAKVTRDRLMVELDGKYPQYGLAEHKGYGTKKHLDCLMKHGPCPAHRRSFSPVAGIQLPL
ncbi:MAG TPA: ribonuclease HII [Dehalococcoidia bacterium]|nr:ribonuclease HII [Dehalococcoidia bacterium]